MSSLNQELETLRNRGVVLPRHPQRAVESYYTGYQTNREASSAADRDLAGLSMKLGRPVTSENYDSPEVRRIMQESNAMAKAMGNKRAQSARMQRYGNVGGTGPDTHAALPRFYDPLEYWDLSGLPWNIADEGHRHKLHKWLRLYYATHHLVPTLVDIFTRFPLVGMQIKCKDPKLQDFYEDLFLNQLNYEDFLVSLGREFWVVGEAFPLGSFDESLGVWEREELINPEDVIVDNYSLLGATEMKLKPPDHLRRLVQTKSPAKEYRLLDANFPELIPYLQKGEHIPVSPVLMRHVANKLTDWDDHGTPILLRGLRTLLHEEKLLASQDAIAERLYSPLILAKLGIMDMGDGQPPWIPGVDELESVRDDLDTAFASDFRLMVHHFGLEMESVFGREQMPRLGDDFDRIERRLMQVFGVNPSLLGGGSQSQPYASSALQAEFLNQILRTFQKMLVSHFQDRARVVAEAQGHYDYEMRGTTRVELFEEIVEYDEDWNKSVVEVPKLLIPDLEFQTLDLRDEATERDFLQKLRTLGVPISDKKLMVGVDWDPEAEYEEFNQELKRKTITQQRNKFETYTALTIQGLPVPNDLKTEVESVLQPPGMGGAPMGGAQPTPPPGAGMGGPGMGGGGIMMPGPPDGGALGMPAPPDMGGAPGAVPGGGPPAAAPQQAGPAGAVPQVSNERRPGLNYGSVEADEIDWVKQADSLVRESNYSPNHVGIQMTAQLRGDGASAEQAEKIVTSWLEQVFSHDVPTEEVASEEEPATLTVEDDTPVEEWELAHDQELREAGDDLPQRITHKRRKDGVRLKVDPAKKYSFIDPEAEPLSPEPEEVSESNSTDEQAG